MKKAIISVVGKDTVGIIAKVCTYLAENQINILDISQTIVQGYFNMMMIIDMDKAQKEVGDIFDDLEAIGKEIGVNVQHLNGSCFSLLGCSVHCVTFLPEKLS